MFGVYPDLYIYIMAAMQCLAGAHYAGIIFSLDSPMSALPDIKHCAWDRIIGRKKHNVLKLACIIDIIID